MKKFDPSNRKKSLDDPVIGVDWTLSRSKKKSTEVGGLASSAHSYLNMAVDCILVGYAEPARRLMEKAHDWLLTAIEVDERPRRYFPHGTESARHFNLAMCNWLMKGVHDGINYQLCIEQHQEYFLGSGHFRDKVAVSLDMPKYVDAGEYRLALSLFEAARMSPPSTLAAVRSEGAMSHAICRRRLGEAWQDQEIEKAISRFLTANINDWLTRGASLRAAEWMKIVHWTEGDQLSPQDVVLNCYNYLPFVSRPE